MDKRSKAFKPKASECASLIWPTLNVGGGVAATAGVVVAVAVRQSIQNSKQHIVHHSATPPTTPKAKLSTVCICPDLYWHQKTYMMAITSSLIEMNEIMDKTRNCCERWTTKTRQDNTQWQEISLRKKNTSKRRNVRVSKTQYFEFIPNLEWFPLEILNKLLILNWLK